MKKLSLIVVLALAIAAGFAQVVINVSPTEITGLDYVYGQGPSDYQILTVSGSGLEPYKSLIIDVMGVFELAENPGGSWAATARAIADGSGVVAPTPIYVRLEAGQAIGNYSNQVWVSYNLPQPYTAYKIVPVSGEVTDPTLPVELSHFSATMTAQNYVQLTWVSQMETNLMGYNVYRSDSDDLSSAAKISDLIGATNTSNAQTYIFYDMELDQEGTHYYWLQNVEMDGSSGFHGPASVFFTVGGNGGAPAIPKFTRLENAYPNPFNPSTTIRYQLKDPGHVKIGIYNTRGQLLQSFERNHSDAGHYGFIWNGCDSSGRELPSGVYLYRMSCGRYSETKKMVLQK